MSGSKFPRSRLILSALVVGAGLVLIAAAVLVTPKPAPPQNNGLGIASIGGPFKLVSQDGKSVTEADFKGQPTLVFFGYTHCPDVCPTTLFDVSQVLAKLPGAKITALFVTLDPERDTPAILKDYLSNFDPRIVGLGGERPAVDAAAKVYRVYAKKVPGEGPDYTYDHSAIVYLMDKEGRFVSAFNLDRPPAEAAKQLAAYL